MRGDPGGRSVLFTAPVGNQFAQLSARCGDFTNPAADGKISLTKNQRLAIDHLTLKIGSWAR
jgi:hypothetical protein